MAEKHQADQDGTDTADRAEDPADRGPGAHSGGEEQARPQVVPGVASGAEGYTTGGTGAGDPLRGVRAEEEETGSEGNAEKDDGQDASEN